MDMPKTTGVNQMGGADENPDQNKEPGASIYKSAGFPTVSAQDICFKLYRKKIFINFFLRETSFFLLET